MEHCLLFSSTRISRPNFTHFFGVELKERLHLFWISIYQAVWGPGEKLLQFHLRVHLYVWLDIFAPVCIYQTGAAGVAATSSSSRGNTSTSVEWEGQLHRSAAQATFLLRLSQLIAINYSSILESEINLQIFQWSYLTQYHLIVWRGGYWFAVTSGQWPPFFLLKAPSLCWLQSTTCHLIQFDLWSLARGSYPYSDGSNLTSMIWKG